MANVLEEHLREAACIGDSEAVINLIKGGVDINSGNSINGWTALHWACKRGNEDIVKLLVDSGADTKLRNSKGETPANLCTKPSILRLLDEGDLVINNNHPNDDSQLHILPNYLRNPPISPQVDIGPLRSRHNFIPNMPTTVLPSMQSDDLVLKVKIANSSDPDYIEIELPRWKLTYATLLNVCCEELQIQPNQVERIRKMPNTRLRKDSDVKRLTDFQSLEVVLKCPTEKLRNGYQSINTKDQTILY